MVTSTRPARWRRTAPQTPASSRPKGDPIGIQVGTAIATLVRTAQHTPSEAVEFRHLWGQTKPADLIATAEAHPHTLYEKVDPSLPLGLPFVRTAVSADWFDWPALPDLFPASFPGVQTGRDAFLVDADLGRLKKRLGEYFDTRLTHEQVARLFPRVMTDTARFDAKRVRDTLLARGGPDSSCFLRYTYRPFDNRWLYWEPDTKLLREKSPRYPSHVFEGNLWIEARERETTQTFSRGTFVRHLADNFGNGFSNYFPAWLHEDDLGGDGKGPRRANLSEAAHSYLKRLGLGVEHLFHHVLTTLHDSTYRKANAGALRMEWPRIPLPGWPDGGAGDAAVELSRSAARGRELAALLDPDIPVPGVTQVPLRLEIAAIAVPETIGGKNMAGEEFSLTAGWGHHGQGDAVMPGQGRITERDFSPDESAVMRESLPALGSKTFDIYLNGKAYWRNVPAANLDIPPRRIPSYSRSGCPIASGTSSVAPSAPTKFSILPIRRVGLEPY